MSTSARWRGSRPSGRLPALADLDRTLELDPGNVDARMTRAALRIEVPDKAEARDDIDAAEKLVAKPSDKRLEIGALYEQVDAFDDAVAQFDLWIQAHPDDSRRGEALNDRCWARAQMGRELDKALADCNTALRLQPHTAMILDSRGLVHLRMGDLDKAIADYDAGLALAPRMAWSLYGRGIAETRKGLKSQGDADLAAAAAINPKLPDRAKALGVSALGARRRGPGVAQIASGQLTWQSSRPLISACCTAAVISSRDGLATPSISTGARV